MSQLFSHEQLEFIDRVTDKYLEIIEYDKSIIVPELYWLTRSCYDEVFDECDDQAMYHYTTDTMWEEVHNEPFTSEIEELLQQNHDLYFSTRGKFVKNMIRVDIFEQFHLALNNIQYSYEDNGKVYNFCVMEVMKDA